MRILVADDQEQVRKRICTILSAHVDYEVCAEATNGVEAVDLARKLKPDLIVLDITMPLMNGLEAARMIHTFAPQTPIVILSVHKTKQLMEEAKKAGALGYVTKEDVVEHLSRAVELASAAQSCYPTDFS